MRMATPLDLGSDVEIFRIDTRAMLSPSGFWRTLSRLDCVLDIGAGDSFADIYGPKRFAFLWLSKMLTILRGVPLVLSPQTIGPFTKPLYRALGAMAMRRSTATFARDEQSLAVARAMAPRARAELAVDVAFVLPFEDRSAERGGAKIRVGVNASGLLFHQAETGANRLASATTMRSLHGRCWPPCPRGRMWKCISSSTRPATATRPTMMAGWRTGWCRRFPPSSGCPIS